jgi:hypothetical protein
MTRERAKELLPVIQAYAEGKEVEWKASRGWKLAQEPKWVIDNEYRIKPEPKLRSWNREEVPLDAWFRNRDCESWFRLTSINSKFAAFISSAEGSKMGSFEHLLETAEHSIDGGKTWLPCGVMEDAK